MKIAIHAGHNPHGKVACGAVGIVKESVVNREITQYLAGALISYGADVVDVTVNDGTRASQILKELAARTNSVKPDLSISIHLNAFNGVTNGTECYYYNGNAETKNLSTRICLELASLGLQNRGAKNSSSLYVLKHITAPSIVVETYFCDSIRDCRLMEGKEKEIAQAIAKGVAEKYGLIQQTGPTISPGHYYKVQVGAFTQKENAERLLMELSKAGFPGYVKEGE